MLRPRHFRDHSIHFLLTWAAQPPAAAVDYRCLRVPPHQRSLHWQELQQLQGDAALADQLVLLGSAHSIVRVLAQFELPQFMHVYIDASGSSSSTADSAGPGSSWAMKLELPRFRFEFELTPAGDLRSLDYAGCRLRTCQRLVEAAAGGAATYTLPDFQQLLVLERAGPQPGGGGAPGQQEGQLMVLVPVGRVARTTAGVVVKHSGSSGAHLKVSELGVQQASAHACHLSRCRCCSLHCPVSRSYVRLLPHLGPCRHSSMLSTLA